MALIRPIPADNGNNPRFVAWYQSTNAFIVDLQTNEKAEGLGSTATATLNGVSLSRQDRLTTTFNCHVREYATFDTLQAVIANTPFTVSDTSNIAAFMLIYPD